VETTERSRFLDSVVFYYAAALTLANYSQSPVTNKGLTPKELQDHKFFLSLRASLIRSIPIDNLNKKRKMINILHICTPINRNRTCHHVFTSFFKLTLCISLKVIPRSAMAFAEKLMALRSCWFWDKVVLFSTVHSRIPSHTEYPWTFLICLQLFVKCPISGEKPSSTTKDV